MTELSLRKGFALVDLEYELSVDTIGTKDTAVAIVDGAAVLKFTLKPVDENQRIDEKNLFSQMLLSVQLTDGYVIQGFREFCKRHSSEIVNGMRLEILSRGRKFRFQVTKSDSGGSGFLLFKGLKRLEDTPPN